MKPARQRILAAALVTAGVAGLCAWVEMDAPLWPNGTVTLRLRLGTSPRYNDGQTPNGVGVTAITAWNPYMSRVQLQTTTGSGKGSRGNGVNDVFFDSQIYGQNFPSDALAVTVVNGSGTTRSEADVVVNSNSPKPWNSYRGPLQASAYDLQRVLIHEFGHVLGLDHPDEHGQYVNALMNSHISDLDTTQQDDQDGIAALYGHGVANPAPPPTIISEPYDVSSVEGYTVQFGVYVDGTPPFTYQWRKNGVAIAGGTTTTSPDYYNSYTIDAVRLADAGQYSVVVTNDGGSVTSRTAVLTVEAAQIPVIQLQPAGATVEVGAAFSFDVYASSNAPITYQWYKGNASIPGAIYSSFYISEARLADAGDYTAVLSTAAGTVTTHPATLVVIPTKPPEIVLSPASASVVVGTGFGLGGAVVSATPVTYQWTKDGVPIPGAIYQDYSVASAMSGSAGVYRFIATNGGGSVTSDPATITVVPLPPPEPPPLFNQSVDLGHATSFGGYYGGPGPVTYQWYHNGQAVVGATDASYYIGSAEASDAGEYFIVVRNASGAATSNTIVLTVRNPSSAASGGWIAHRREGGIEYFLFANPARIERFDLAHDRFLGAITLSQTPVAMTTDSGFLYVAFGTSFSQFALDGTNEVPLGSAPETINGMFALNGYLYVVSGDYPPQYRSFNLATKQFVASTGLSYDAGLGFSVDRTHSLVFSWTRYSTSDIDSIRLNSDGTFGGTTTNPDHGSFPYASATFVFPDDTRVVDNSGTVYATTGLTYVGSIGAFDDIGFTADGSAVTLGLDQLAVHDSALRRIGEIKLPGPANLIAVSGAYAHVFTQPTGAGGAITWRKVALDTIAPPQTAAAVDPTNLAYAADDIWLDRDGVVVLYSKLKRNLFRWSPAEQRYLGSIGLQGSPNLLAYSAPENALYLAYADNTIRVLDFAGPSAEQPFAETPMPAHGLAIAGEYVFAVTYAAQISGDTRITFSAGGAMAARNDGGHLFSRSYAWNLTKRRIYWAQDPVYFTGLGYLEIRADGTFGVGNEPSSYEQPPRPPLRISPSGENVLVGSGAFFNADTLAQNNALPNSIEDAAWLGTTLYTGRTILTGVQVQRWGGSNYGQDASARLSGRLLRLFALDAGRLLAVTMVGDQVAFTILDASLRVLSTTARLPQNSRLLNLSTRADCHTGDNVLIPGFVIAGTSSKRLLVRAVGPGLGDYGVAGFLANPTMTLKRSVDGAYVDVATNDDWETNANAATLATVAKQLGAFALNTGSKDAALLLDLDPGQYTVVVSGLNGGTGVGLVELYDGDSATDDSHLVNISTRGFVGVGGNIMIPGFVVSRRVRRRSSSAGWGLPWRTLAWRGCSGIRRSKYFGRKATAAARLS